jgi:hypothetical protein
MVKNRARRYGVKGVAPFFESFSRLMQNRQAGLDFAFGNG